MNKDWREDLNISDIHHAHSHTIKIEIYGDEPTHDVEINKSSSGRKVHIYPGQDHLDEL